MGAEIMVLPAYRNRRVAARAKALAAAQSVPEPTPVPKPAPHKVRQSNYGLDAWKAEQAKLEAYEDLRDDVMSLVKNSGMSFEDIHDHCGPTPHTLENWAQKKVSRPQLGKIRAVLTIIGYKITFEKA